MYSSVSEMHCRTVTYLTVVATILSHAAGELVIAPRNTESKVGEATYFNCSTDLDYADIFWNHDNKIIYNGHGILEPYNGRFDIDRSASTGSHNLVIHSVEPGDAGQYVCSDDEGAGTKRSAKLIVLGNDPECNSNIQPDGVIGQNIFNIPPDEVQLSCSVIYYGKMLPQLEWRKVGDDSSVLNGLTSVVTSINLITSILTLKGDISLDKSSYVCQTTMSTQNQYNCTSEIVKVLYFAEGNTTELNVVRGYEISCIVNNNTFPCTNQWYHDNYSCPLSCDETIKTHLLGEYLCTVRCHVRGRDYYFEALKVLSVEPFASPFLSTSGKLNAEFVVPVIICIVILLAVPIAVLSVCFYRRRKKSKKKVEHLDQKATDNRERAYELMSARLGFAYLHVVEPEIAKDEDKVDKNGNEEIELVYKGTRASLDGVIIGIAILNEELFIALGRKSTLKIYDCKAPNFVSRSLTVKGLVAALDMCSCKINTCLYIIDDKISHSEVMKLDKEGKLLKKWTIKDDNGYGLSEPTLSATPKGNLIIAVHQNHVLLEFSSNGDKVDEIVLQEEMNPWHAVKLNDSYIVSYGDYSDESHGMCKVNKEGKRSHNYGSAREKLNMPVHFAVDSNNYVIVVDHFNDRLLLFDSELKFQANIVPKYKQKFLSPRGVCLDDHRLAVVIGAGDPRNTAPDEEIESMEAPVEDACSTLTENSGLLTKPKDSKIEEDCRLLVFDIKPLLEKYKKREVSEPLSPTHPSS